MPTGTFIKTRCPNPECRREFRVKAEFAGKTATCKGCGQKFVLIDDLRSSPSGPSENNRSTADSLTDTPVPAAVPGTAQIDMISSAVTPPPAYAALADILKRAERSIASVGSKTAPLWAVAVLVPCGLFLGLWLGFEFRWWVAGLSSFPLLIIGCAIAAAVEESRSAPLLRPLKDEFDEALTSAGLTNRLLPFALVAGRESAWSLGAHSSKFGLDGGVLTDLAKLAKGWQPFTNPPTTFPLCAECGETGIDPYQDVCILCGSYLRTPGGMLDMLYPTWGHLKLAFDREPAWRDTTRAATGSDGSGDNRLRTLLQALAPGIQPISQNECSNALRRAQELATTYDGSADSRSKLNQALAESLDLSWLIPVVEKHASTQTVEDQFNRLREVLELVRRFYPHDSRHQRLLDVAGRYIDRSSARAPEAVRAIERDRASQLGEVAVTRFADLMEAVAPYCRSVLIALDLLDPRCPHLVPDKGTMYGSRVRLMVRDGLFRVYQPMGVERFTAMAPYANYLRKRGVQSQAEALWPWAACIALRDKRSRAQLSRLVPLYDECLFDEVSEVGLLMTNYRILFHQRWAICDSPETDGYISIGPDVVAAAATGASRNPWWPAGIQALPFMQRWPDGVPHHSAI